MTKDKRIIQAQKDFDEMLEGLTKDEIIKAKPGYGITAMRFARRYADEEKENKVYKKIYHIYFDYFENK